MIKNQWYVVLETKEIKKGKITCVKRLGQKVIFWRDTAGTAHCIADRCCHRGASLGCGHVIEDKVQCPFHGFEFGGDGKVTYIPANGKKAPVGSQYSVESYLLKEAHGFVWMWWGDPKNATDTLPFFDSLSSGYSYSTLQDHWPVHYTRCIENQLDCVHLPFVHRTTIGKSNKTIVDGPKVTLEGNLLRFYVHNTLDEGNTLAKDAEDLEDYHSYSSLEFLYPHLWHNVISDQVRAFAAFVPIDEENTTIYLRFYQKFLSVPLLTPFVNFLGKEFSKIILHQDKRVVITQLPKKSELHMDEKLIAGDAPIIAYRKHRDELKNL